MYVGLHTYALELHGKPMVIVNYESVLTLLLLCNLFSSLDGQYLLWMRATRNKICIWGVRTTRWWCLECNKSIDMKSKLFRSTWNTWLRSLCAFWTDFKAFLNDDMTRYLEKITETSRHAGTFSDIACTKIVRNPGYSWILAGRWYDFVLIIHYSRAWAIMNDKWK